VSERKLIVLAGLRGHGHLERLQVRSGIPSGTEPELSELIGDVLRCALQTGRPCASPLQFRSRKIFDVLKIVLRLSALDAFRRSNRQTATKNHQGGNKRQNGPSNQHPSLLRQRYRRNFSNTCRLLECVSHLEDSPIIMVSSDNLHSYGKLI